MKPQVFFLTLIGGIVVGAVLVHFLVRPATSSPGPGGLVDGKYLVVESEDGHWIYERTDQGFRVVTKEISPAGLSAIWALQGDYTPASLTVGGEELLSVPSTMYSTETRSFQVIHRFYRIVNGKLQEVPMEEAATPAAAGSR